MDNAKILFVAVLILTLLVGGSIGFLMGERTSITCREHPRFSRTHQIGHPGGHLEREGLTKQAERKKQKQQKQHEPGEWLVKALTKKCNLTDEQQEQVKGILESKRTQIQAVREDVKNKVEEIKEQTDEDIKAILTEEQKEKFETYKQQVAKKREAKKRN